MSAAFDTLGAGAAALLVVRRRELASMYTSPFVSGTDAAEIQDQTEPREELSNRRKGKILEVLLELNSLRIVFVVGELVAEVLATSDRFLTAHWRCAGARYVGELLFLPAVALGRL